ncbi:MAG TPA: putative peptidoglycan glycosyltransferase FtsW, partial [Clostridia bacterium]
MDTKKPFDFWIFATVLVLLSFGIIMVFSASAPYAYYYEHDTYYFLKKQLMFGILGLFAMAVTMKIDYRKLGKLSPLLLAASIFMLIMVRIPGIGRNINGAWRWFYIGSFSFQPSEVAKIAVILFLSFSLAKRKEKLAYFSKGLFPYLMLIGVFAGLLMLEPHFSCTILICFVSFVILYCAGAKLMHFFLLSIPAVLGVIVLIIKSPYRLARVLSFLDPWKDLKGNGWQVVQSLYAIGSGGVFGRGLGHSLQKFLYIPEPHNDFIFAILSEELGFVGVVAVL